MILEVREGRHLRGNQVGQVGVAITDLVDVGAKVGKEGLGGCCDDVLDSRLMYVFQVLNRLLASHVNGLPFLIGFALDRTEDGSALRNRGEFLLEVRL